VTIDWTVRESAQLRVIVKRILRKYSYPPGQTEKATQAECDNHGGIFPTVGRQCQTGLE